MTNDRVKHDEVVRRAKADGLQLDYIHTDEVWWIEEELVIGKDHMAVAIMLPKPNKADPLQVARPQRRSGTIRRQAGTADMQPSGLRSIGEEQRKFFSNPNNWPKVSRPQKSQSASVNTAHSRYRRAGTALNSTKLDQRPNVVCFRLEDPPTFQDGDVLVLGNRLGKIEGLRLRTGGLFAYIMRYQISLLGQPEARG